MRPVAGYGKAGSFPAPCYLLKDALEGVLSQIREGAKAELEAARAQEAARAESEKKEETE